MDSIPNPEPEPPYNPVTNPSPNIDDYEKVINNMLLYIPEIIEIEKIRAFINNLKNTIEKELLILHKKKLKKASSASASASASPVAALNEWYKTPGIFDGLLNFNFTTTKGSILVKLETPIIELFVCKYAEDLLNTSQVTFENLNNYQLLLNALDYR
jgi:hypothetical protein